MAGHRTRVIDDSTPIIGQYTTADIWNRVIELSASIIAQDTLDALHKNVAVSKNISWLHAKLPKARVLFARYESWGFTYKHIDNLLPQLKQAIEKARTELDKLESQKQTLEGANLGRIPVGLVTDFKNWICGFPDNVESAKGMLDHVCHELENIYTMLDIPKTPNQFSEHISRLRATLPRARLLIERSECWRIGFDLINKLLPQLKEAVYNAENELDDIESKKRILEGANWEIHGKLLKYLRNCISGFPDKVKSAQGTLDYVCNKMEKLCQNYEIPENLNQFSDIARPILISHHPKIYGREKELDDAIHLLGVCRSGSSGTEIEEKERNSGLYIGESSNNMEKRGNFAILPIVGMEGVGKTTLAQMIYNDERVQSYFDLRMWNCVYDKFDLERLKRKNISAPRKECNFTNLNKRVLLVLDDIWSKDWQDLLWPMNESSKGSAIIITCRSPTHLQCTRSNMTILKSISLEGLQENIYWDFFKICAGLVVCENYGELEDIAREICSKHNGSPLAAKVLGSLLSKRTDKQHWINIRDNKMWKLKQEEEHHIIPVLRLSYQYLPSHLKKCFSFCSLYPRYHKFTDVELAKLWIMEGFVPMQENLKDMEDLALSYLHELEKSCFFQRAPKSDRYEIHDLMHDICQSITAEECYCLENENFGMIYPNTHHLSVFIKNPNIEKQRELHKLNKLDSLLVASPYCGFKVIQSWFDGLTSIRCLSLSKCKIKTIPGSIGNLRQLQYLDISDTEIKKLPNSFWTLYNLQHLDMSNCNDFLEPSGFSREGSNNLTGLKYFRPPPWLVAFLILMPNLFRAMQRYDIVYNVENDGRTKIENLKHLTGVRGYLSIRGLENVSRREAAEEAALNKQELLDTLYLHWDDTTDPVSNETHMEVLEGLHPHFNLTVLEIVYYNGQDLSPSWMGDALPNLRRVCFKCCFSSTLSQLPRSITELEIDGCKRLTSLQDCLQPNLVPKLKCIAISGCGELVSVPVESFCEFASLDRLAIKNCYNITCPRKMILPPSIKILQLRSCCELDYSIPSCLQNLTSLEYLDLYDCRHLVSIPNEVMRNLKSLQRLYVGDCQNLESLGDEEFLESIKICIIKQCPNRKISRGQNPDGKKLSDIPYSSNARKRKARE